MKKAEWKKEGSFKEYLKRKWVEPSKLEEWSREMKKSGKSIATLNGSFDILHAGHLYILYEAAKQADILIVALNTDESIRGYKSPGRPFIPLTERLELISAIEWVDYATWFSELDPREVLSLIAPEVHVNGAEYGTDCIEKEVVMAHGGRLHLVDRIEGLSTSNLIQKIVTVCGSSGPRNV